MINLFRKRWYLIILAFLATILFILKYLLKESSLPQTTPKLHSELSPTIIITPAESLISSSSDLNIISGVLTKYDLEQKLGQPTKIEANNNYLIYYYPSENENWPTQIYLSEKENKVVASKRFFPSQGETYQSFVQKYGVPDKEFFGPHEGAGFSVYLFLKKGVAIVSNSDSGIVLEIWTFIPTSLEDFLSSWGKDLSLSPTDRF